MCDHSPLSLLTSPATSVHSTFDNHSVAGNLCPLHLRQSQRPLSLLFPLALSPLSSQRRLTARFKNLSIVVVTVLLVRFVMLRTPPFQPPLLGVFNPLKFDTTLFVILTIMFFKLSWKFCSIIISIRSRSSSFLTFSAVTQTLLRSVKMNLFDERPWEEEGIGLRWADT